MTTFLANEINATDREVTGPIEQVQIMFPLKDKNINYYYSFKIFPRFGLVETTRIIHHKQLLFTKFGKNLRRIQLMTSKVEPAANYSTADVRY